MKLSVISPVYGAERLIPQLVNRISAAVTSITNDYEIILVDDCGPDNSWEAILKETQVHEKVIGIRLSRNFGQHYAITAGLDHAKGEWVVVMDCDLQDRPEEIPALYAKAIEGYDIVLARRFERKDSFLKKLFSFTFYKTLGYLTGFQQDESVANFGIYHKKVIQAVCSMRESIRYFPTMVKWVGFKATKINVEHSQREEGKSGYNLKKMLHLAMDIILAYSDKPIRLLVKLGLLVSLFSFIVAIKVLFQWLVGDIKVLGYTSLFVSIWFLSGLLLSTLGLVGLYVGKTFQGVKNRPIYIIAEKTRETI
ncbi:MAG: glycosyltransferase family 2 protein [Bacteroidia bacterium]|nr:glycosyltransferase family 2 protein [Bacteroidia bacterium]MCC6769471.1 glycosyltransferase family 2 protein [Bacteroidia bacterium]